MWSHFNPRTREGCDAPTTFKQYCTRSISIHAPVKGATASPEVSVVICSANFNPRTREGCDADCRRRRARHPDFNPRTREGCDLSSLPCSCRSSPISIHAPVKGATTLSAFSVRTGQISIHAPVKGATRRAPFTALHVEFQSTHP